MLLSPTTVDFGCISVYSGICYHSCTVTEIESPVLNDFFYGWNNKNTGMCKVS